MQLSFYLRSVFHEILNQPCPSVLYCYLPQKLFASHGAFLSPCGCFAVQLFRA